MFMFIWAHIAYHSMCGERGFSFRECVREAWNGKGVNVSYEG